MSTTGVCLHVEDKLRTVLWGWAGKPVDDDTLDKVACLVDALAGSLGDALADHITSAEIAALRLRARALLKNPVMPGPDGIVGFPGPRFRPAAEPDDVGDTCPSRPVGDTGPMSPEVTDAALAADLAEEAGSCCWRSATTSASTTRGCSAMRATAKPIRSYWKRLRAERQGDAVLSEEAYDDLARLRADRVWIVDPLDGTREFSWQGCDDWAVHVALWQRHGGPNGAITDAAVALPAIGELYRSDTVSAPTTMHSGPIRITASSNRPPAVLYYLARQLDVESVRIGWPEPKRCRWCAATPMPTSMPAASGSGIRLLRRG